MWNNYNGVAKLFNWIPGVGKDGGPIAGIIVGFISAPIVYFILAPLTGAFAGVGLFVGMVLVFGMISTGYFRAWWKLRSSDPDSLLTISSGPVEFEGIARSAEQTVVAPYTSTESILCEYEKEKRQRQKDEDGDVEYTWNTVSDGVKSTQFILESNGREILVDPEGMKRMLSQDHRNRTGNTRVRENRLDPGDGVYVTGIADEHTDKDNDWGASDHQYIITAPDEAISLQLCGESASHQQSCQMARSLLYCSDYLDVESFS
ncbi:hypothetical protein K0C01_12230 [Salinarchaeum sp. IM2453]|uniref:hypothetical protein n=1 Tax=Salinarchaeum sp. IM2453 TaxID=2862870 RepID=UPI001C829FA3|nr:hypothetical protein [Salinarchaeum sp. IM2453]QZA88529.1 hypothetical protein K0C01_12230 [Salinarchaeum sp. IM2453]